MGGALGVRRAFWLAEQLPPPPPPPHTPPSAKQPRGSQVDCPPGVVWSQEPTSLLSETSPLSTQGYSEHLRPQGSYWLLPLVGSSRTL